MIMPHFHSFFTWRNVDTALLLPVAAAAAAMLLIHVTVHGFSPCPRHVSVHEKYDPSSTCTSDAFSRTYSPAIVVCASIKQQAGIDTNDDGKSDPNKRNVNVTGVTLKMAFDENWAVADDAAVTSERFTSPSSLDLVHLLRRASDAVLVGKSTVQRDNCTLTVRRVPLFQQKQPVRVVVDPNLSLLLPDTNDDAQYALFHDGLETIVYCRQDALLFENKEKIPANNHVQLVPLPTTHNDDHDKISTVDILTDLGQRGIHHVMVEGGPATALHFLQQETVDRAILIRAPIQFSQPVESTMSMDTLIHAGLILLGTSTSEGDVVEYWSRVGVPWPTDKLTDWP